MKTQELITKIVKHSVRFKEEVKELSKLGLYDINIHAESFLIPLLDRIFNCSLENLNHTKQKSFPSVDIADFENRIAFQITSTNTASKVNNTLKTFFKYSLDKHFDKLYIVLLQEKPKTLKQSKFAENILNDFEFDAQENIVDLSGLNKLIASLEFDNIKFISRIYEHEFSDNQITQRKESFEKGYLNNRTEVLRSNLLEVDFPKFIYISRLNIDFDESYKIVNEYRIENNRYPLKKKTGYRNIFKELLKMHDVYDFDWIVKEGNIYTFINLETDSRFTDFIDIGNVEKHLSEDFFATSEKQLNYFKELLKNAFIDDCRYKGIELDYSRELLRFKIDRKTLEPRKERWKGKKTSTKTVVQEIRSKSEGHIVCFRHLAFTVEFYKIGLNFYITINPTYSYTNPGGYMTSRFESSYMSKLKAMENNHTVYYAFSFIEYFLTSKNLFSTDEDILKISKIDDFKLSPSIDDRKWTKTDDIYEDKDVEVKVIQNQLRLEL